MACAGAGRISLRMTVAKAKGRLRGKQPKLNPCQDTPSVAFHSTGEPSTAALRLIVAADGLDAVGAVNALKAAHKAGKVQVISFDATAPNVQALKQGIVTALITQQARLIGKMQVKALVDYLEQGKQGPVPTSGALVAVPQVLLTKSNVSSPSVAEDLYVAKCS